MVRSVRSPRTTVFLTILLSSCLATTLRAADKNSSQATTQPLAGNSALRVVTSSAKTQSPGTALPPAGAHLFQLPVKYATGGYSPFSVAIADVNGDGTADVVVANQEQFGTESSVGVLLGNGDGTFQTALAYDSGGVGADDIVVADLNADGHPDLIVANGCTSAGYCSPDGVLGVLL